MEVTPNWLEMPDETMRMILERIGVLEILNNTQKVCTTWRRICKNPSMWKVICINHSSSSFSSSSSSSSSHARNMDYNIEKLSMQAVHRSCGELVDFSLHFYATDHLLDYISRCSSKVNHLLLSHCYHITGCGLNNALKRLPHLETLDLFGISLPAEDIEVIGRNCPQLHSFKMKASCFMDFNCEAHAIANSMPALCHLQLDGSHSIVKDDGIRAILNGCLHLESLDLCRCFYIHFDSNLEKLCRERIKDFKFKRDNIPKGYEESDMGLPDDDVTKSYGFCDFNAVSS